jgi:hypothetical protein
MAKKRKLKRAVAKRKRQALEARKGKQRHKISAWRVKPRDVSRQAFLKGIRQDFERLPLSKAFLDARRINENTPDDVKRAFLFRNKAIVSKAMTGETMEGKRVGPKSTLKFLNLGFLEDVSAKDLNGWVNETKKAVRKAEARGLADRVTRHLERYFKERKIPVRTKDEKAALRMTLSMLLSDKKMR